MRPVPRSPAPRQLSAISFARFLTWDALELAVLGESFDTVLDCGLFHVFENPERVAFAAALRAVMPPAARYYLLCVGDLEPGQADAWLASILRVYRPWVAGCVHAGPDAANASRARVGTRRAGDVCQCGHPRRSQRLALRHRSWPRRVVSLGIVLVLASCCATFRRPASGLSPTALRYVAQFRCRGFTGLTRRSAATPRQARASVCDAGTVSESAKKASTPTGKAGPAVLQVRGLTRRFGEHAVVSGLDIDVSAGQAVVLVGPNGSGKSTVLRCIVGADEPTEGTVELEGRPLDERSPSVRSALASVLDDLDFFPDLSVVEHLDLFAKAHSVPDAEMLVDAVLEEIGLVAQSDQLPGTLSSGQRRRLALASAFVRPRRLLILDEPEARLDTDGIGWLAERLQREKEQGLAILMASHHPELVEALADVVVRLGERS